MATENRMTAVIGADISELKTKLSQAEKQMDRYAKNISGVQSAIGKSTQKSRQYESQLQKLNKELKQGSISQEQFAKESNDVQNALIKSSRETKDFQRELDRLQKESTRLENSMENLSGATTDYANSTKRVSNSTQQMTGQVGKLGKTTKANAVPAMQSFSQVVQDAPYGIQGVANNIQQLTAQFGYLSTQAGGSKAAIKGMVASLTGPAGILLAVSLVTVALQSLSNGNLKLSDILRTITFQSNDAAKALRELNKSYRDGAADVRVQILEIETLVSVIQDENSTREAQLRAYNELKDIQPKLVEGMNLQELAAADLTEEIDQLSKALLRQAKIEGFSEVLAEKYKEISKLTQQAGIDTASFLDIIQAAGLSQSIGFTAALQLEGTKTAFEDIQKLEKEAEELSSTLASLMKDDLSDSFGEAAREIQKNLDSSEPIRVKVKPVSELTTSGEIIPLEFGSIEAPDIQPLPDVVTDEQIERMKQYMVVQDQLAAMAKDTANSFSSSFALLGDALAGGEQGFEAFLQSFKGFIGKLIAQMLAGALANAIFGATESGAATGPGAVFTIPTFIAAMTALVSGAFGAIGFAQGGIVPGGSFSGDKVPAMVNSGEMILNYGQQRALFNSLNGGMIGSAGNAEITVNVVGQISGENINLANDRYQERRARRG